MQSDSALKKTPESMTLEKRVLIIRNFNSFKLKMLLLKRIECNIKYQYLRRGMVLGYLHCKVSSF